MRLLLDTHSFLWYIEDDKFNNFFTPSNMPVLRIIW